VEKFGIFSFQTGNIGDDMQALSMLLHLKQVDAFLNRDNMTEYVGDEVNFVSTAAFPHGQKPPPLDRFKPFFWGMCLGDEEFLRDRDWLDYFEACGPFGGRDTASADALHSTGVASYWAGCITLFLGRKFEQVNPESRRGVVFVDVTKEEEERFVPSHISKEARRISNFVPVSIRDNQLARFAYLAKTVDILRKAKLVVTRRLHVALPCVGLGTPVIALPPARIANPRFRFSGFDTFLPVRYTDEAGGNEIPFDWDNPQASVIPAELEESYGTLCRHLARKNTLSEEIIADNSSMWPSDTNTRFMMDNPARVVAPAAIRLMLGDKSFEPSIHYWDSEKIVLDLKAFPGFDRLPLTVMLQPFGSDRWLNYKALSNWNGRFV